MRANEAPYYKINRVVLKMLGLWPYQQSCLVRLQNVLFIVILASFIVVQLLVLVTTQYNANVYLRVLSITFPNIYVTIQYCLYVVQAKSVKQLLEKIHDDWSSVRDRAEINILKKYACNGRFFTIITMSFCYFGMIACGIFQSLPLILDIVTPLNESRPYQLVAVTEYYIDQDKYYYAILMHEVIAGCIGATALCSTVATLMMYMYHACALFRIARFVDYLTSDIMTSYVVLIIVGVGSLSLNLFQLFQLVTLTDNTNEMFIFTILVMAHLGYLFMINYGGQEITEHGIDLFQMSYNVLWYATPLRTQRLLLFVMQKGTRNVTLTCGGLFVISMECFASLTSTAVSYFTVIYSTR